MSAINIIGKSQRVVDAPGLSIEELAGKFSKSYDAFLNIPVEVFKC